MPTPARNSYVADVFPKIEPFRPCISEAFFLERTRVAPEFQFSGLVGPHILEGRKKNCRLFQPAVRGFVLQKYRTDTTTLLRNLLFPAVFWARLHYWILETLRTLSVSSTIKIFPHSTFQNFEDQCQGCQPQDLVMKKFNLFTFWESIYVILILLTLSSVVVTLRTTRLDI